MKKEVFFYFKDGLGEKVSTVSVNDKIIPMDVLGEKAMIKLDNLRIRNNKLIIWFEDGTQAESDTRTKQWERIVVKRNYWTESSKGIIIGLFFVYLLVIGLILYLNLADFNVAYLAPLLTIIPLFFRKEMKKYTISFQ